MDSISLQCPFCFEWNDIPIEDEPPYETIVDCAICCHPMEIRVTWSEENQAPIGFAGKSSGFD